MDRGLEALREAVVPPEWRQRLLAENGGGKSSACQLELTIKQLVDQFHFPFSELGQICESKCCSRIALLAHFPR